MPSKDGLTELRLRIDSDSIRLVPFTGAPSSSPRWTNQARSATGSVVQAGSLLQLAARTLPVWAIRSAPNGSKPLCGTTESSTSERTWSGYFSPYCAAVKLPYDVPLSVSWSRPSERRRRSMSSTVSGVP